MSLGSRIELLRQQRGISQAELARRVKVTQSTMNSLIKGDSRTSRSLLAIARELQTTPAYLTGETDDPSIDAAELALSSEDRALLEMFNGLEPDDRKAVMRIMQTMSQERLAKSR